MERKPLSPFMLAMILLFLMLLFMLPSGQQQQEAARPTVSYTRFLALVEEGSVDHVTIRDHELIGELSDPRLIDGVETTAFDTQIPEIGTADLMARLESAGVDVVAQPAPDSSLWSRLIWLLPWIVLLSIYFWMARRLTGAGGGMLGRGGPGDLLWNRKSALQSAKIPNVRFKDVAGQDSAKAEVAELIDFLREPERYRSVGAEVPHGLLLVGAPGTGKTLLARALAGEAHVPFFAVSGSAFIEVFVGVGAGRVRRLFEEAKKQAPAIIFIDELDSIGRVRGAGLGGGHDEREQTLNQILAEMDGFEGHEAIVVLAATNRPDVLDPALLRPGRFDRHITLDMPDRKARRKILKVHTDDKPLAPDIDLDAIAGITAGFSGADLKNLVNEAAMMAAREKCRLIETRHFEAMRDRVVLGSERALTITPEEKHRLAVHEAGHATVAFFAPTADPLFKVAVIPRGQALGATQQLPEHERYVMAEDYLRDRLAVMLGGRAAERTVLGSVSSGADDDIRQATGLAKAMVSRWGMSEEVGPVDVRESESHPFLGREIAHPHTRSEATARAVDRAVHHLISDAQERAEGFIRDNRAGFDRLVARLEREETLGRAAIEACLLGTEETEEETTRRQEAGQEQETGQEDAADEDQDTPHARADRRGAGE